MAKVVIVTGASGNLGHAVVKKFLSEGYQVIGTAIPNDPGSSDFGNSNFEKAVLDLANEDETLKLVESVSANHGSIDAAVLTVGGFAMSKIAETNMADINKQYKLNFETAFNIARPVFLQMMRQNQGRIFLVGSKPGLDVKTGKAMVAYSLSKSLIFRLAEILNEEAKGKNVVTSVLVPSTIDTPENRKSMPDANFDNWVKAESIADVIFFYCTDAASIIREPIIKVYNNT